jgi:membrane protease YdiL (CAAX protease family)
MRTTPRVRGDEVRRLVVLSTPAAVPISMAAVFAVLGRRLPPRTAYNVGFVIYWAGWCLAVPMAVLGPRRALRVLASGKRPSGGEALALLLPVVGGLTTECLPRRQLVDRRVLGTMIGSAAVNATAEELLWRGMFLDVFPEDPVRGSLWPLAGFSLWHLAPQIIFPSRRGRWRFVAGAAVVGAASALVSWRTRGLRWVLLPHIATDACGITAARFRLGLEPAASSTNSAGSPREEVSTRRPAGGPTPSES